MLPRLVRYQERFDDHQFQIAEVVKRIPRIVASEGSPDDFRQKVVIFLHEPPVVEPALEVTSLRNTLCDGQTKLKDRCNSEYEYGRVSPHKADVDSRSL